MTQTIKIENMRCKNCADKVKEKLAKIQGVKSVKVNLDKGAVTLDLTRQIPMREVKAALSHTTYRPVYFMD